MDDIKQRNKKITETIRGLLEESGKSPHRIARLARIEPANFYRLLEEEREWNLGHLEKLAPVFGKSVEELLTATRSVPVVERASALRTFPYPQLIRERFGKVNYLGGGDMLNDLYAVEVDDRSMMPAFKQGTKFIVQKESFRKIKDEDIVICVDQVGQAMICYIRLTPETITLKSLNPTIPDTIMPRTHLKVCDKVLEAIYPE
ncbi:MAG: S24 family peptidase [Candidatus Micrarchaeia archaeon]|jgi:SOS-response transcriptional repressor LexA